jgi:hypothetical protein
MEFSCLHKVFQPIRAFAHRFISPLHILHSFYLQTLLVYSNIIPAATRRRVEINPALDFNASVVLVPADVDEAEAEEEAPVVVASVAAWLLSTEVPIQFS